MAFLISLVLTTNFQLARHCFRWLLVLVTSVSFIIIVDFHPTVLSSIYITIKLSWIVYNVNCKLWSFKFYLCFIPIPQVTEHDVHFPLRHSPVLRGQSCVLHCLVSILFLSQIWLVPSNFVVKQDWFRVDTPPPHDFEHGNQGNHDISGSIT